MTQVLDAGKPGQRILALKRYKEMLQTQRDRFRDYLVVLDKQHDVINRGETEALLSYVEIEEHIVKDIFNIQKAVDSLELLCGDLAGIGKKLTTDHTDLADTDHTDTDRAETEAEVAGLRAAVEGLKNEATVNAARNRDLLAKRIVKIRSEINSLRGNPFAERRSIYADNDTPSMIDIQG